MDSRDFMPTSSKPSYDRLADVLEDDEVEALAGGSHATPLCHSHELQSLFLPRVSSRTPLILSMTLNLGLLLVLMALGGALYQNTLPREPTYEFLVPPNVPMEYQTVRFNATVPGTRDTEWLGPSNDKTDALWDSLLDVGVIALDAAQISHLSPPPARLANGQDGWAGTFEVFHQIHCLNLLRKRFFAPERNGPADWGEAADLWAWHNEHCFEYLRQTLLCHADVNIFPLEYDARHEVYVPRPSAEKRCRNWDVVHEYAREHMATDTRRDSGGA